MAHHAPAARRFRGGGGAAAASSSANIMVYRPQLADHRVGGCSSRSSTCCRSGVGQSAHLGSAKGAGSRWPPAGLPHVSSRRRCSASASMNGAGLRQHDETCSNKLKYAQDLRRRYSPHLSGVDDVGSRAARSTWAVAPRVPSNAGIAFHPGDARVLASLHSALGDPRRCPLRCSSDSASPRSAWPPRRTCATGRTSSSFKLRRCFPAVPAVDPPSNPAVDLSAALAANSAPSATPALPWASRCCGALKRRCRRAGPSWCTPRVLRRDGCRRRHHRLPPPRPPSCSSSAASAGRGKRRRDVGGARSRRRNRRERRARSRRASVATAASSGKGKGTASRWRRGPRMPRRAS